MTPREIDNMSYEAMLRKVRFAPLGDPLFTGPNADYFLQAFNRKKNSIPHATQVAISKEIGWKR